MIVSGVAICDRCFAGVHDECSRIGGYLLPVLAVDDFQFCACHVDGHRREPTEQGAKYGERTG